jgi:hypothetical protein
LSADNECKFEWTKLKQVAESVCVTCTDSNNYAHK